MIPIYHIAAKRSGHALVGRMIRQWCPDAHYVDCENRRPGKYRNVGGVFVLQVRDLLNWYASYVVHKAKVLGTVPEKVDIPNVRAVVRRNWDIMREYYHDTHYLRDKKVVYVAFDGFVADEYYRRRICRQLDGMYTEDTLQRVMDNGDGSSFDGRTLDGCAAEMDVLHRYRQVPPVCYRRLFKTYPNLLDFYLHCMQPDSDKEAFLEEINCLTLINT